MNFIQHFLSLRSSSQQTTNQTQNNQQQQQQKQYLQKQEQLLQPQIALVKSVQQISQQYQQQPNNQKSQMNVTVSKITPATITQSNQQPIKSITGKIQTPIEKVRSDILNEFKQFSDTSGYLQFYILKHPKETNKINAYFHGDKQSMHSQGLYKAEFIITENYPAQKPIGRFLEPLPHHCNISSQGAICVDFYNTWNKNKTFKALLEAISYLLNNPNPKSPYRSAIADMQLNNPKQYEIDVKLQALKCKQAFIQD